MGTANSDGELSTHLLTPETPSTNPKIPNDAFNLAYIIYFILGAGFLLPWNAFTTAVDYFNYLYPEASVNRTFAIVMTSVDSVTILLIIVFKNKHLRSSLRINIGSALFLVALLVVPFLDMWYVKGRVGVYGGYYVTVCLVGLCGCADALVQGGILGSAGELPEKYMQALTAGTAGSGVLVSFMRILTKALYPQDAEGLRKSAIFYFSVSIAIMAVCIVLYNVAHRLPVIKYYNQLKIEAVLNDVEDETNQPINKLFLRSTLWEVLGNMKWYGCGILMAYTVSWSLFPGSITEYFHSLILKSWYPILLITGFNVFDLLGKSLTSVYLIKDQKISIGATFARVLFLPVFYLCLHGPKSFRSEIPISILTCLLGFTNGYFISVLMILAPKTVQVQHADTAGLLLALFGVVGPTIGSPLSYLLLY